MKSTVTKERVLEAIGECADKLKRTPTTKEFVTLTRISAKAVCNRFGSFGSAIRAAGLVTVGPGYQTSDEDLLKDWARVARTLGRLPTKSEYHANSNHSEMPFLARWKWWHKVGAAFEFMAGQRGLEEEWADVLEMVRANAEARGGETDEPPPIGRPPAIKKPQTKDRRLGEAKRPLLPGRPFYGALLNAPGLAMAPVCEDGVIFVFGMLAHQLGFTVLRIQKEFPDCEALWEIQPGRWQWVRIEFEFESRNFAKHGHDPKGCDLIVCWTHNWEQCPKELEVVELKKKIARIAQNCPRVKIEELYRGFTRIHGKPGQVNADESSASAEEVA